MSNSKKILIFCLIVVVLFILIPIIGNSVIKEILDSKLQNLEAQGIQVTKNEETIGYLETSRHYEFLIDDSEEFLRNLQKYSNEKLPSYTKGLVGGLKIGLDVTYSNIPFSKVVSLDIYPLSIPLNIKEDLQTKDHIFSTYIEKFLFNKGLLCHIEYELRSDEFTGYIKDINENYTLKNNSKLILKLSGTNFKGKGDLITPSLFDIDSKKLLIKFVSKEDEISFSLEKLSSSLSFTNETSYISSSKIETLNINGKKVNSLNDTIDFSKISIDISSSTQNEKIDISTKLSFKNLQVNLQNLDMNVSDANYDFALLDMDEKTFEKLRGVILKARSMNTHRLNRQIQARMIDLFSKGIKIKIRDFSTKKIVINNENIKGFLIQSEINLKEDRNLATKMMFSPLLIVGNIELDFKSKVSKKILEVMVASSPLLSALNTHIQTNKDVVELNITYKKGNLKINDTIILGR